VLNAFVNGKVDTLMMQDTAKDNFLPHRHYDDVLTKTGISGFFILFF
jgi:hypothetical protein